MERERGRLTVIRLKVFQDILCIVFAGCMLELDDLHQPNNNCVFHHI